jgi:hypothetical protein
VSRRVCCTHHCRACGGSEGRHFHSVAAFDAHRVGDFASNDPAKRRRCRSPLDVLTKEGTPRLVALSDSGVCAVAGGEPKTGVTIWTIREGLERARAYWDGDR